MDDFSAHADRDDLLAYVGFTPPERLKHIFLVHGESEEVLPFQDELKRRGYHSVHFPAPHEKITV